MSTPEERMFALLASEPEKPKDKTLAEKALGFAKGVASYPVTLPANPSNIGEAVSSGDTSKIYREIMPSPERWSQDIKSAKSSALGNISGKISEGEEVVRGKLGLKPASDFSRAKGAAFSTVVDLGLDLVPWEPSSLIAPAGSAIMSKTAGYLGKRKPSVSPVLASPSRIEDEASSAVQKLAGDRVSPESVGTELKKKYEPTSAYVAEETASVPEPQKPEKKVPKRQEDILEPMIEEAGRRISPDPVSLEEAGLVIDKNYSAKEKFLADVVEAKEGNMEKQFGKVPFDTSNTKAYLDSLSEQEMNLYPVLKKLKGQLGKIKTWKDAKATRTAIAGAVKSYGEYGNIDDHVKKEVVDALTKDMKGVAEASGFGHVFEDASAATRALKAHQELTSSQTIKKTEYASKLLGSLIDAKTPGKVDELFNAHGFTEAEKNVVRRGILDEMARKSKGKIGRFITELDKYTPETKKALFGDKYELVESIKDASKIFEQEKALANAVPDVGEAVNYAKKDIMSADALRLDKMMDSALPSEVVGRIVSDGSPEVARAVEASMGKDGVKLLRRGILNKIIDDSFIHKGGGKVGLIKERAYSILRPMSDGFIDVVFGEDANTVKALRETYKQIGSDLPQLETSRWTPLPEIRQANWWSKAIGKYRLYDKVRGILGEAYGRDVAEKILPGNERGAVRAIKSVGGTGKIGVLGKLGAYPQGDVSDVVKKVSPDKETTPEERMARLLAGE